ncbi:unnamed protein product [Effrenium voratum]|uniref:Uncharacterized protein n=1 Tax=Effrenium voratum TaxID=2562239 RepID=A0AA36J5M0_9DINO|nr:unnamed protein product [Effrenium voratum]CAJ1418286.1 unnamed protein product [Effrenium voratum]
MGSDDRAKKKTKTAAAVDDVLGGLYDFLPPPDPVKDEAAKAAAVKNHLSRPALPPADKTRVIFLDVDGVILPAGSIDMIVVDGVTLPAKSHVKESDFSAQALGSLRAIVQQTGATIVLSSEWRRGEDLKSSINAVLKSQDIPYIRDATPIFQPRPELQKVNVIHAWCERRAREIGKWLKESFPGGLSLRDTWLVAQKMSLPPRIKEVLKILTITMAAAFQPILSGSVIVEGAQCWQP